MLAICFICFWVFMMAIFSLSVIKASKEAAINLKKLHEIPCYRCDFYTRDHRLKCTVHPLTACSEEALGCLDFEPKRASEVTSRRRWEK